MTVYMLGTMYDYIGLSSDTKPTEPPIGSRFLETDTKQLYIYNGTSWVTHKGEEFDISVYPVRAQGTVDGVQYDTTGTETVTANTDVDLWTFDSSDYFPRVAGELGWTYYNVSMELKAKSATADLKWRLQARDVGTTTWQNMSDEQTETDIGTTYVARRAEGYLDIQTGAELMPLEIKVILQSNEATTGVGVGRIKNDTVVRMVGEVK